MARIQFPNRSKSKAAPSSSGDAMPPPPTPAAAASPPAPAAPTTTATSPPPPRPSTAEASIGGPRRHSPFRRDRKPQVPQVKGNVGLPTPPKRQRSTGWMIGGAAIVLLSGFAAASMARSYTETVDVLVAAEPIAEGEPIQADQLAVVPIAAGEGDIQAIAPSGLEDLIGRVASGPIGEGSILHPDQFVGTDAAEQMVIVGMALDPDEFPAENLKSGDLVRLFDVGSGFGSDTKTVAQEITIGEVVALRSLGAGNEIHYSIRVNESSANAVTSRVTQDALAIALVDDDPEGAARTAAVIEPTDDVDPLAPADPLEPGDPLFDEDDEDTASFDEDTASEDDQ